MNVFGFALAQLTTKAPSIAAVVCAGVTASNDRPWYVWGAFLAAALCMNQSLTYSQKPGAK
jgi:hypothetical protein